MSFLSSLLAWENAPFLIVLGVAVGFGLLQMTGLLGLVAGGGDHDHDHDVDGGDADGDADHDADADGDHDADHEHEHEHEHEHDAQPGLGAQLLAGLGVGRAPLSIVWQTFAVVFGFVGIAANTLYLGQAGSLPRSTLLWTVPLALVVGYVVTRAVGKVLGRMVDDPQAEATSRKELVGHTGVVISSKVNAEFGEVRVHDKTGHVVRLICRTREGEPEIPEGAEVVIVDHDRAGDHLFVAPLDEGAASPGAKVDRAP